jgi:hypothetical protein
MRRWTIYITLLLLLSAATPTYNEIVWSSHAQLHWDDFNPVPQNKHYAAVTASGISFSYTTNATGYVAEIFAVFDKDESWVDTNFRTDALLKHERLHFDITELWTRKLRKAITEGQYEDTEALNILHDRHLEGLIHMQAFYDEETYHSLNIAEQREWDLAIASELNNLSSYQDAAIVKTKPFLAQK